METTFSPCWICKCTCLCGKLKVSNFFCTLNLMEKDTISTKKNPEITQSYTLICLTSFINFHYLILGSTFTCFLFLISKVDFKSVLFKFTYIATNQNISRIYCKDLTEERQQPDDTLLASTLVTMGTKNSLITRINLQQCQIQGGADGSWGWG